MVRRPLSVLVHSKQTRFPQNYAPGHQIGVPGRTRTNPHLLFCLRIRLRKEGHC
jgi:hypothetical protein